MQLCMNFQDFASPASYLHQHCTRTILGLLSNFSDNLGGTGLHNHKCPIPWSIEGNHNLVFSLCSFDYSFSTTKFKFGYGLYCPKCAFLTFLHPSEWHKMLSGLDINLSLNDHFAAEWVASVLWPAGLDRCPEQIQFASVSLVAMLIIAKAWRQWWDLATNVSESVWQFQWVSLLLCISFNFWNLFSDHLYLLVVRMYHILKLGNRLYTYNHQGQHEHNWLIFFHCSYSCF